MMASTTNKLRKPAKGVAIALAVVGVAFAGNSALGLSGDDNGRDGTTVPGAPSDAPSDAPAPTDDSDAGRDGASTPGTSSSTADAPALSANLDNGRGFDEPALGPNPVTLASNDAASDAPAAYDTDSGQAPVADATTDAASNEAPSAPSDQDVPGAPTANSDGSDAPSNDQDG